MAPEARESEGGAPDGTPASYNPRDSWSDPEDERAVIVERLPDGGWVYRLGDDRATKETKDTNKGVRLPETLLMRDGRRLHRFPPAAIPPFPSFASRFFVHEARRHRAVLVADGMTLVVVEPKGSTLPRETLAGLRVRAGAIIAVLRGEPFPQGRPIAVYDSGAL